MTIDQKARGLADQIETEIRQYTTEVVNVGEAYDYSQYKLVRRITLFESHTYPTGKFDSQGNYKFWYDGISSRISNEVKNIDFDTKDVKVYSDRQKDDLAVLIINLKMAQYLRDNAMDEEFNAAVEEGSGWGNVVWKRVKKSFERADLKNFYVINQTAQTLKESPVIERHQFTASDLRGKVGSWDAEAIKETLKPTAQSDTYKPQVQSAEKRTTVPYYDIYERNGEVKLSDLLLAYGETPAEGDDEKYIFAKVIAVGSKGTNATPKIERLLFCQDMPGMDNGDIYREFHRGIYKGKWMREGMYELLFDQQVRLNQIGNQISQALELGSKVVLQSADKLVVQNILTDMRNGDVIRTQGLTQVGLVTPGVAQLIEEWNIIQQLMNDIANSSPIVTGEGLPQRMPFQVAALLNQNSNKLFDYIRQKLAIPFTYMFQHWIVPEFVADLSGQEILRLTGDSTMLARIFQMVVDDWYVSNLLAIGPHGQAVADFLKGQKLQELQNRPQILIQGLQQAFKNVTLSVSCVITGENSTLPQDMQTLSTFIALEEDPIRRTALIELAMSKKGIDVASLPKSGPPDPTAGPGQGMGGGGSAPLPGNQKVPNIASPVQMTARPTPPVRAGVSPNGGPVHSGVMPAAATH